MDLVRANVDNLRTLWRKYGVTEANEQALIRNVGWPHRVWFEHTHFDITGLSELPQSAIYPVLPDGTGALPFYQEKALCEQGWRHVLQQTAMTLALTNYCVGHSEVHSNTKLALGQVRTWQEVRAWTDIASAAFSYRVDPEIINRLRDDDDVFLLLVTKQDKPVATAILLRTDKVFGIHQVGVKAEYRGQGIAQWLMLALINKAQKMGAEHLVLQASITGKPMYQKLGFNEQFIINSYQQG